MKMPINLPRPVNQAPNLGLEKRLVKQRIKQQRDLEAKVKPVRPVRQLRQRRLKAPVYVALLPRNHRYTTQKKLEHLHRLQKTLKLTDLNQEAGKHRPIIKVFETKNLSPSLASEVLQSQPNQLLNRKTLQQTQTKRSLLRQLLSIVKFELTKQIIKPHLREENQIRLVLQDPEH